MPPRRPPQVSTTRAPLRSRQGRRFGRVAISTLAGVGQAEGAGGECQRDDELQLGVLDGAHEGDGEQRAEHGQGQDGEFAGPEMAEIDLQGAGEEQEGQRVAEQRAWQVDGAEHAARPGLQVDRRDQRVDQDEHQRGEQGEDQDAGGVRQAQGARVDHAEEGGQGQQAGEHAERRHVVDGPAGGGADTWWLGLFCCRLRCGTAETWLLIDVSARTLGSVIEEPRQEPGPRESRCEMEGL